jgi:hypothetical protein
MGPGALPQGGKGLYIGVFALRIRDHPTTDVQEGVTSSLDCTKSVSQQHVTSPDTMRFSLVEL